MIPVLQLWRASQKWLKALETRDRVVLLLVFNMDVIQTSSVKIPNSVIVSGVTDTETDEELHDFLKKFGSIQRVIPVDSTEQDLGKGHYSQN